LKPRDVDGGDKPGHGAIHRHSPDTGDYMASIALLTGFNNGHSPLPRAKGDQGLQLKHSSAEARQICDAEACLSCHYLCASHHRAC